ncbi:MAG: CDP-alcohol phosphatidyltransferase family protein [Candidatus Peregrinibacteria bacterium]
MEENCNLKGINTFSAREASYQSAFGAWRQRAFSPLLKAFDAAGVSPDTLSVLGIAVMMLLPLGFTHAPVWCVVAYLLHLLFDGLDGSLARHRGTVSPRGAYLDVVVDHSSLIVTVLTLQWFGIGKPFWVSLYTICYLILVVHFVLMNVRGNPPTFPVVRTKYLLFLLTALIAYSTVNVVWF